MFTNQRITSQYFKDTCDVYSNETQHRGHIEVDRSILYSSIPCYVYNLSNTKLNQAFGVSQTGRYKFLFPLKIFGMGPGAHPMEGTEIAICEGYIIEWTDNSIERQLQIEIVTKYSESHIEVEAVEVMPR